MMSAGQTPPSSDITSFRRYCQAMLILRHRLPASAVAEFQVREWLDRKLSGEGAIIRLAGPGAAGRVVTLSKEEESMLDCYFSHARSISLQNQAPGKSDQGRFFLGTDGAPVINLGSDLIRLREKYSAQEPGEMEAAAPTPIPAACASASGSLQGQPPASSATPPMQAGSRVRHWDAFRSAFPVTVHAEPPSRGQCAEAGFTQHRAYYLKWREAQLRLRKVYILEHAVGRRGDKPRLATVQRLLAKETWGSNRPTAEDIMKAWMPPQSASRDEEALLCSVKDQRWKGLAFKDFGEGKGLGVVATMPFQHLQVLCDYHGEVISAAEGNRRQQSGYLFFFRAEGGARLCIDATASPCACHQGMDIFGRRLNHSRSNPNARAKKVTLRYPDGPKEAVIFVALRDISVGEELLWDYGVTRQSFGGGGQRLSVAQQLMLSRGSSTST
ncbi:hypothetical protein PFLUV_G00208810 [Perca fluviatilis]|uniref:SET domain-containing protein n=1 Tax=Perca fluviatilis TaxID=8168 RepID=A0A6A5EJR8_PERFL|nr:hypothetical protein PFLUV_G00208810 [Perca fluviatilis]